MQTANFHPEQRPILTPRFDEEEEREEPPVGKTPMPVGAQIQRKFLEQRQIFLWGAVTDESAKDLTEKLLYLEAADPGKEITFFMNTPGGSVTAGMAVYDTIKLITFCNDARIAAADIGDQCSRNPRPPVGVQPLQRRKLHQPSLST